MFKRKFVSVIAIGLLLGFTLINTGEVRAGQATEVKVPDVSIKLMNPDYLFFAMSKTGEMEVSLADVAEFHGHLCPGVALGFRAAQEGYKALYGNKLPVREEVMVYTSFHRCPADVLSCITGARTDFGCPDCRGSLVLLPEKENCFKFVDKKTGKTVKLEPLIAFCGTIRPIKMKAKKDPEFLPQFHAAVNDAVNHILFDPVEKVFKITVVE